MEFIDVCGNNDKTVVSISTNLFSFDAIKSFGLFLAEMQGADGVQLRYDDGDNEMITYIDMNNLDDDINEQFQNNMQIFEKE